MKGESAFRPMGRAKCVALPGIKIVGASVEVFGSICKHCSRWERRFR